MARLKVNDYAFYRQLDLSNEKIRYNGVLREGSWTKENLIDTMLIVGDKTISNYINNTVKTPIDFPEVKAI